MPLPFILRRLSRFAALLLAGCFHSSAQLPTPSPLPSPVVVHFDSFLGRGLTVKATLHGVEGTFLFDTGGGLTNISPAFAARIGCRPWGQITGFTMQAHRIDMPHCDNQSLDLAGVRFPLPVLGVFDLNSMMPPGTQPLDGTLSLDALAGRVFTLSYSTRTLTLETPASLARRTSSLPPVPVRLVRDAEGAALSVDIGVPTSAGTAYLEIDSGNTSPGGLLGRPVAALFHADPAKAEPQFLTFKLPGGASYHGDFVVRDLIMDGNLGTAFLAHWDLTVDLAAEKAWLSPAKTAP